MGTLQHTYICFNECHASFELINFRKMHTVSKPAGILTYSFCRQSHCYCKGYKKGFYTPLIIELNVVELEQVTTASHSLRQVLGSVRRNHCFWKYCLIESVDIRCRHEVKSHQELHRSGHKVGRLKPVFCEGHPYLNLQQTADTNVRAALGEQWLCVWQA